MEGEKKQTMSTWSERGEGNGERERERERESRIRKQGQNKRDRREKTAPFIMSQAHLAVAK